MKLILRLSEFFIFTNIFLAAAVSSLVFETYIILYNHIIDFRYAFFLFCSTLFIYCFHRVFRFSDRTGEEKAAIRHLWIKTNRRWFSSVLLFSVFGILLSIRYFVKWQTILYLFPVAFVSLGYTVPFIPSSHGWIRLRDIPGVKIFLISLVFAFTTVFLPVFAYDDLYLFQRPELVFIFFRRVLFIFSITIPFDIRDMDYDKEKNTKTIPLIFGAEYAKKMAVVALFIFIAAAVIQYFFIPYTNPYYIVALILSALVSVFLVMRTNAQRNDYFYSFFMEGMMLLQCLLVFVAGMLN